MIAVRLFTTIKKIDWTHHTADNTLPSGRQAVLELYMKLAGFLFLLAGWVIVLAALALLGSAVPRNAFLLAGLGVEVLGLVFVFRSHLAVRGERE